MTKIINSDFKAPWILRSPRLQTCLATLSLTRIRAAVFWEELQLPDGDFVDLAWVGNQAEGSIAFLIPGMEGSLNANYIAALIEALLAEGWRVVVLHFRCCSGRINTLPRAYSANDSDDLHMVAATLRMQHPGVNIVGIGFSLGASILLKTLSHLSELEFQSNYFAAAVGISIPFDLAATVDNMPTYYQHHLLRSMKAKVRQKIKADFSMPVSLKELAQIKSLREFDQYITAPLQGFANVEDYYKASSCSSVLSTIKVNTLLIHALDDPLVPNTCIPSEESLGENMHLELSERGGHLGFLSTVFPWNWRDWLVAKTLEFIRPFNGSLL